MARISLWVVLWPQSIPYESLGLLGSFTQYLVDRHHTLLHNGYWFAWMIHVAESLYAMVLCNSLLIMCLGKQQWMAQVLGLQPRGRPKRSSGPGFSLAPPQPLWLLKSEPVDGRLLSCLLCLLKKKEYGL
nr:uncharacterized protein LOC127485798 isoform X4 [Oryctolagus cuniculus]